MANKTKVSIDVGLLFQDAGNSLQKILNNLRTSFTKGEFSNIFGKSFESDLKRYQDVLTKVSTFKLTPQNTLQYQQVVQELEQAWLRLSQTIETSVASQELIDPQEVTKTENKLKQLKEQFKETFGVDYTEVYARDSGKNSKTTYEAGALKGGAREITKSDDSIVNFADPETIQNAKLMRQEIAQTQAALNKMQKTQQEQIVTAQQADAAEKALTNSREQHEHVIRGLADAHRQLANDEALANRQNAINNIKAKIQQYTSFAFTIQFLRRQWTQLKKTYQEVDKQLTSIAMVSGKSQDSLWAEIGTYNKLAQELGKSTTEVLEASKLFYQQGLSTNEVLTLTTESLKLAAIAETDAKTATDYLTTAINGFKLEASQASMVTDTWAELAGRTAVDVEDLAVGISKVASIAQSAGMELQATSAFLTQIIETTREAPETAGTALKTIIARFQELKTAPGALEDGVDANKVEAALKTAGVALRDTAGQFRDFDDVILELSSKWDDLDRNTQRYIATIAAGSRQQSRFIALVDDYDSLVENMAYANDSAGASMQQFTAYSNGLEASIQRSKTAWEGFYLSLKNGNNIVSFAFNTLTSIFNLLSDLGPGVTLILGAIAVSLVKTATAAALSGTKFLEYAKTSSSVANIINLLRIKKDLDTAATMKNTAAITVENGVLKINGIEKASSATLTAAIIAVKERDTIVTWKAVAAQMGYNVALIGTIAAIVAVAAVFLVIYGLIKKVTNAEEERIAKLKEEAAAAQEVAQQEQELLKTYEDLSDRLDKVATGEENLEDVRNALIAQFGPYITFMDKTKESVNLLTASYEDLIAAMEGVEAEQAAKAAAANYRAVVATNKAVDADTASQIRSSESYQQTKEQFSDVNLYERGAKQYGFSSDGNQYNIEYYTEDEAKALGFNINQAVHVRSTFIASDGTEWDTLDEVAQREADIRHGVVPTVSTELISETDATSIATTFIDGFDEKTMAEKQLIIEGLQQGLIELEEITQEIDGKEVVVGYTVTENSQEAIAGLNDIQAALDGLNPAAHKQFNQLLAGELDWSQLTESVREELLVLADNNDFVKQLITNWESELAANRSRVQGMLEAAGLRQGGSTGTYYTNDWQGNAATDVMNALGTDPNSNLELKDAFLAQWNALANDPEAQQAYAAAIQALIDSNAGNISALTPEMFTTLGSDNEAEIGKAFQGLLNEQGEIAEGMNQGYYDALAQKLGTVSAGYYSAEKAAQAYRSSLEDITKAQEGMSRTEMEDWIWRQSENYEALGYETRQAAIAAFWANSVTEDGITYKQLDSELLQKISDEQGVVTQSKIDDAIVELETSNAQLESKKRILTALKSVALGSMDASEAEALVANEMAVAYGSTEDSIQGVIDELNPLLVASGEGKINAADNAASASKKAVDTALKYFNSITNSTRANEIASIFDAEMQTIDEAIEANNVKLNTLYGLRLSQANKKSGSGGKSELERQRELLDKQKEILEAEGDAQEKRIKLIQEELKARKDALKEEQDAIKDAFEQQQEQWEIRLEYVRDTLEAEREALEEAADAAEDAAQKEIDAAKRAAEGKINLIQMQIDAMDEEAEAEDRLLKLQKARDEYERARTSKTRLVLTKGAGWIFKTDNAQVEDAATNLRDTERDYQKSLLEAQIAEIEKVVESMEDVEGLLGMTADEIAAMNEATKKWSDYIINGTFADEVATQIGTSVVDSETGVKNIDPTGVAQVAINASQAVADWVEKFEPVLEALEAAIERLGTSMEDMLLDTEAEEKILNDFFNEIVGAGGTNEMLSVLDKRMVEVEASQRKRAEQSAEIDETIKQIEVDLEAWDEQLDRIGLSSSEIAETQRQVAEYQAATLEELGIHGKYYQEIVKALEKLADGWEQYNKADADITAQEKANKGFSSGGVANFRGRAMLHGSTSRPEVVLNNSQAAALFNWVNGLGQERYRGIFDSLDMEINKLKWQINSIGAAITTDSPGDTYNFGTVNIESDADSIEQLVTDIRRLSPLTRRR